MKSEIENRADFNKIRYSMCWEDADLLLTALNIKPTDKILSVASAGDNAFAMLSQNPQHVLAVDLSFAQIACCELRKTCYKYLDYESFIKFSGALGEDTCSQAERLKIFYAIKKFLPGKVNLFWSNHINYIKQGFMRIGRFENYFKIFRTMIMPLIHDQKTIDMLLSEKNLKEQVCFYDTIWNTTKWKCLFKIFFSKTVMGKLGRDPEFYKYVSVSASESILNRSEYALKYLSTFKNPYLNYILKGCFKPNCLPFALREENFLKIKENIDKIEFKQMSIEDALSSSETFTCLNLSDIFEYMSEESMSKIYLDIFKHTKSGAKIVYWNMLVNRKCPMPQKVDYDDYICHQLLSQDKAFFYQDFILEIVK